MIKYVAVMLFLVTLQQSVSAELILDVDLNSIEPISVTNARHFFTFGGQPYWAGIDKSQQSELIFEIPFPVGYRGLWSNTFFNAQVSEENPSDYLITYAGRTNTDWRQLDSAGLGKPYRNFTRDSTFASDLNDKMFVRALFSGNSAIVLWPGARVRVALVPEPFGVMPIVSAAIVYLCIRRGR
jgi:hypothetical protein